MSGRRSTSTRTSSRGQSNCHCRRRIGHQRPNTCWSQQKPTHPASIEPCSTVFLSLRRRSCRTARTCGTDARETSRWRCHVPESAASQQETLICGVARDLDVVVLVPVGDCLRVDLDAKPRKKPENAPPVENAGTLAASSRTACGRWASARRRGTGPWPGRRRPCPGRRCPPR